MVVSVNLNSHSKGMSAGLDYELTRDLLLGFSVGISKAEFKINDRMTVGNIETGRTALYGAYRQDNFYVDVDWFDASINRSGVILPTAGAAAFVGRGVGCPYRTL